MSLVSLLFSFKGRINRQQYWFGSTGIGFAAVLLIFGVIMMIAPLPGAQENHGALLPFLMIVPIVLMMGWAGLAIQVKRFHDRNQPGWLVALPLLPAWGMGQAVFGGMVGHQSMAEIAMNLQSHMMLMNIINLAFLINLGWLRGSDGPNKYGDPPAPWGRDASTQRAPQAPRKPAKDAAMPAFLSGAGLSGAADAIDRAIAEAPQGMQPAPIMARASAAPSSFGRAPVSGVGFGKKR